MAVSRSDGLLIAQETELCEKYMGKFPVISVTLKGVDARSFEDARAALSTVIGEEALRFRFLLDSDRISEEEKLRYRNLITIDQSGRQEFAMSGETLRGSLLLLSRLLGMHYGQKVIILIDEYDVPLDKAQHYGDYDEMVDLIRSLFGRVL